MKHLLLLFSFLPLYVFGQISNSKEISYEVGSPYPVVDAYTKQYFEHNGEILTFKRKRREFIIQKLDARTLKFKSIRNYTDLPREERFEDIEQINGKLYYFYSIWDDRTESKQLYVKELDFAGGKMNSEGKRIIKTDGKANGFYVESSKDEQKLMVKYRKRPEKKNDDISYDIIGFYLFDWEMNPLWNKEVKMPYTEKKMNNIDYSIDSYGNSYILTTVYKDNSTKRFKKDGSINYHMELMKVDAKTKELTQTKIELNDQHINRIWLYESEKGKMVCAGFFNDGKDSDAADGVFMAQVDEGNSLTNVKSHDIPVDVINLYKSRRIQNKNEKKEERGKNTEFQELELREFITRTDGSAILVGEQHYSRTHTTFTDGRTRNYTTYHYNDILISKLNPDGSLAWMKVLPKRQQSRSPRGSLGFKYFTKNNNHYLLLMDHYKNLELSIDKYPKTYGDGAGGNLIAYKVTDDGTVSKIKILDTNEVPELKKGAVYQFNVDRIMNISDNEFVVEFYKKKKEDVLIKFKIN